MVERYGGLAGGIVPADDGPWVRYSDYMVMEADRDFWKERFHVEARARIEAEALSRTGAVKVKALEWEERKTRLGTVWWSAPNPLGGLSIEAASENDKIAAQADFEHRILSALEPAAPEGRQDDEPRAYIVHAPEDDYYGTGPDRLQFHPLAQRDLDNGYRQTPLYDRPSEQAVTEAMERFERIADIIEHNLWRQDEKVEDAKQIAIQGAVALKAAMEAGR